MQKRTLKLFLKFLRKSNLNYQEILHSDGCGSSIDILIPEKISRKKGYFQYVLIFNFNEKGKLSDVCISKNDYQLTESDENGNVLARIDLEKN